MSEAKHTPGPWIAGDDEDSDLFLVGPASFDDVVSHPVVSLHSEANARLIAAAPELLEALLEFVRVMDSLPDSDETSLLVWDTYHTAKAAIAKATGGAK